MYLIVRSRLKYAQQFRKCLCQYRQINSSSANSKGASLNVAESNVAESTDKEEIIIPKRIQRSSTDILDALSSTVHRDCYSPKYIYIDDPAALPISSVDKKAFALSLVSGKRAAQYVIKTWPKSFVGNVFDQAVPVPDIFQPSFGAQSSPDTEEGLRERIELHLVSDAYASYQKNVEAGVTLSQALLEDLLDLLCVYNSQDEESLLTEENAFIQGTLDQFSPQTRNTWKDSGPAEQIFKVIENPSSRAYCSLIKGRTKYHQMVRAIECFNEARSKNIKFDNATFSAIITAQSYTTQRSDDKIKKVQDVFKAMDDQGAVPTLEIFNTTFEALGRCERGGLLITFNYCSQLLSEMSSWGIEPSLATWYHLLKIIYREENCQNKALYQIIDKLEGKDLTANHPDDFEFFSYAISKAHIHFSDLELCYRINNLLNHNQNYRLLGDNSKETSYYNMFFKTLCTFEQIETVMEYYDKAIPHWFTPNHTTIHDLIQALDLNEGYIYLPKIWTDMFSFQYERFPAIMSPLCGLMARRKQPESFQHQYRDLVFRFYDNMRYEVMILEERGKMDMIDQIKLTSAELLGRMCQVCLNSGDIPLAKEIFGFYQDYRAKIGRSMDEANLESLIDVFIKEKDFSNCLEVLTLMSGWGYKCTERTAEKIKSLLELTEDQVYMVDQMM